MKKSIVLIIMIFISCICFVFAGLMIGFHNGQKHVYDKLAEEEREREKNKVYKVSERPGKPLIGAPIKSRRFKSKLLGNTREVSQEAKARIAMIE